MELRLHSYRIATLSISLQQDAIATLRDANGIGIRHVDAPLRGPSGDVPCSCRYTAPTSAINGPGPAFAGSFDGPTTVISSLWLQEYHESRN